VELYVLVIECGGELGADCPVPTTGAPDCVPSRFQPFLGDRLKPCWTTAPRYGADGTVDVSSFNNKPEDLPKLAAVKEISAALGSFKSATYVP